MCSSDLAEKLITLAKRGAVHADAAKAGDKDAKAKALHVRRLLMQHLGGKRIVVIKDDQINVVDKLINVLGVVDLSTIPAVERELMLLKVAAPAETRSAILDLAQVFRANVVDVADHALTLEVVGDPGKLVALEQVMESYGILEIARTGRISLERASGVNTAYLKTTDLEKRVPA